MTIKIHFITTLLCLTIMAANAWAVPAKPGQWHTLTLDNGRQVRAELIGDEYLHFWQTENGECYIRKGDTYCKADKQALVRQAQTARMERQQQRWQQQANRWQQQGEDGQTSGATRAIGDSHAPYTGTKKGLIILVQFSDLKFSVSNPQATFEQVINGNNYTEGNFKGSVRDYFLSQSGGIFELDFDVLGPVTLKNGYAYYGQDGDERGSDKHPGEMVADACKAVAEQVNFADYDWDGDYQADQVFIIYAGKGQADGGTTDTIWPHEWNMEYSYGSKPVFNNIVINTYACGPELNGSGTLQGIGTICHEFSHCLGLPDTYDTDYNGNYGMGTWDLMCSGSYNGNGFSPANYTAFEQAYIGWKTPIELKDNDTEVKGMKPIADGGDIYSLTNEDYPSEYYLLENRQPTGWDSEIKSGGLLVTHVDFDSDVWRYNVVNTVGGKYMKGQNIYTTDHQHLTILPADGILNTSDEDADTYPYNLKDSISNTSSPTFSLYHARSNGSLLLGRAITDIRQNGDGTVSFNFRAVDTNTEAHISGIVFRETFDQCAGKGGNDSQWSGAGIAAAAFTPDNKGWSVTQESGGDRCAKFGTFSKAGSATTPKFSVAATAKLTFLAAPWAEESNTIGISVSGGGNSVTLSNNKFSLTPGKWTPCEATLSGTGEIAIRFTPTSNRFFLDDIKVEVESSEAPSSITHHPSPITHHPSPIYNLQGAFVGHNIDGLAKGIYIIGGKKVVKAQ